LFKDLKTDDCEKLKGLMTEGGLGTAPEALGHAVGIGLRRQG